MTLEKPESTEEHAAYGSRKCIEINDRIDFDSQNCTDMKLELCREPPTHLLIHETSLKERDDNRVLRSPRCYGHGLTLERPRFKLQRARRS